MHAPKLLNLAISAQTMRHAHPTLQKAIDYAQKIEREFLLVEGIKQNEFDTVMSIDANAGNDPVRQQGLSNIKCFILQMWTKRPLHKGLSYFSQHKSRPRSKHVSVNLQSSNDCNTESDSAFFWCATVKPSNDPQGIGKGKADKSTA